MCPAPARPPPRGYGSRPARSSRRRRRHEPRACRGGCPVSRAAPRRLAESLDVLTAGLAPASTLARVQDAWERAVGPAIAAAAHPGAERDGVLTVVCEA